MYLESNKTAFICGIHQVGTHDTIDPGLDGISDGLHTVIIPFSIFKCFAPGLIVCQILQPCPAGFIVYAPAVSPRGGIDLHLVTVYPPIEIGMASDLNA